jgi:hypothetical protein
MVSDELLEGARRSAEDRGHVVGDQSESPWANRVTAWVFISAMCPGAARGTAGPAAAGVLLWNAPVWLVTARRLASRISASRLRPSRLAESDLPGL